MPKLTVDKMHRYRPAQRMTTPKRHPKCFSCERIAPLFYVPLFGDVMSLVAVCWPCQEKMEKREKKLAEKSLASLGLRVALGKTVLP